MSMFLLNIREDRRRPAIFCVTIAVFIFSIFFTGLATPVHAAEAVVPSFGAGKVAVRLYTDYFCPPCRAMEPKIEPIIAELVRRNIINLIFVDTPLYKASPLYARYFMYVMNEKKDLDNAVAARSVLIGAAVERVTDELKLEEYLKGKGIRFKPFDTKATFDVMSNYLKSDKITVTPSCIIVEDGKTTRYKGGVDILAALEGLRQPTGKSP